MRSGSDAGSVPWATQWVVCGLGSLSAWPCHPRTRFRATNRAEEGAQIRWTEGLFEDVGYHHAFKYSREGSTFTISLSEVRVLGVPCLFSTFLSCSAENGAWTIISSLSQVFSISRPLSDAQWTALLPCPWWTASTGDQLEGGLTTINFWGLQANFCQGPFYTSALMDKFYGGDLGDAKGPGWCVGRSWAKVLSKQ